MSSWSRACSVSTRCGDAVSGRPLSICCPSWPEPVSPRAPAIALAADRGTSLTGLWEAVFTFRHEASGRLAFVGPRQLGLVRHYVVTGALAVTVVSGAVCFSSRRRVRALAPSSPPWATAAIVLTCWELAAAVAGGDAWSHYLIGVVPGVALLTAVALRAPGKVGLSLLTACLLYAGVAAAVAWSMEKVSPRSPSDDQVAASYVRDHANRVTLWSSPSVRRHRPGHRAPLGVSLPLGAPRTRQGPQPDRLETGAAVARGATLVRSPRRPVPVGPRERCCSAPSTVSTRSPSAPGAGWCCVATRPRPRDGQGSGPAHHMGAPDVSMTRQARRRGAPRRTAAGTHDSDRALARALGPTIRDGAVSSATCRTARRCHLGATFLPTMRR